MLLGRGFPHPRKPVRLWLWARRKEYDNEYVIRNPSVTELDTSCDMSEHEVRHLRSCESMCGVGG